MCASRHRSRNKHATKIGIRSRIWSTGLLHPLFPLRDECGRFEDSMKILRWMLCLTLASAPIWAQTITGAIVGAVSDQSGALLPGVSISATNEETGLKR